MFKDNQAIVDYIHKFTGLMRKTFPRLLLNRTKLKSILFE